MSGPPFTAAMAKGKGGAALLAIVGGALLVVSGFTGVARWEAYLTALSSYIEVTRAIEIAFRVLLTIASLGGFAVIGAGILIARGHVALPRLLILIGVGFGFIGLLILFVPQMLAGEFPLVGESALVTAGVILSLMGRALAKR